MVGRHERRNDVRSRVSLPIHSRAFFGYCARSRARRSRDLACGRLRIDELWLGAAFVGLVAAGLAWRARRAGRKRTLALVALILGGLVAAQVIAFTIGWGIYHVAT